MFYVVLYTLSGVSLQGGYSDLQMAKDKAARLSLYYPHDSVKVLANSP